MSLTLRHPNADADKHRQAARLSTLLPGVTVRYEPDAAFTADPSSKGHCFAVSLDPELFECGSDHFDAREAGDGNLVVLLAASLQAQAERLTAAAVQLIDDCDLSRMAVIDAVERLRDAEQADRVRRQKGGT